MEGERGGGVTASSGGLVATVRTPYLWNPTGSCSPERPVADSPLALISTSEWGMLLRLCVRGPWRAGAAG